MHARGEWPASWLVGQRVGPRKQAKRHKSGRGWDLREGAEWGQGWSPGGSLGGGAEKGKASGQAHGLGAHSLPKWRSRPCDKRSPSAKKVSLQLSVAVPQGSAFVPLLFSL